MPGADVVAVVAPPTPAGPPVRRTGPVEAVEVEIPGPVVVAEHRMADGLHAPPGSVVHRLEIRRRRAVVLDVAKREHRSKTGPDEKVRGGTLPTAVRSPAAAVVARVAWVAGDVAGRRDHRVGPGVCRPLTDYGEHCHRGCHKPPRGQGHRAAVTGAPWRRSARPVELRMRRIRTRFPRRATGGGCSPSVSHASPLVSMAESFKRKAGESGVTSRQLRTSLPTKGETRQEHQTMLDSALPRKSRSLKGNPALPRGPPAFARGEQEGGAGQDTGADYLSAFEHPPSLDRVKVVPHLPGSASSDSASRRSEARSSSLSLSSTRDSSAALN